jgi:hypothetical protein
LSADSDNAENDGAALKQPVRILRKKMSSKSKTEIGWCELVDIPTLGLTNVHAKMDSGAATSSIHATRVKAFEKAGKLWVSFWFKASIADRAVKLSALVSDQRVIRSSNGVQELRYVIEAQFCLGNLCWDGHLTLANRGTMAFPVLIGRRALRRGFLVNSGKRWMLGKPASKDVTKDD